MARPPKNNCDYFPHDAGMRNHKKVKAIRSKFGINGYGIWSMVLEHLTGSDGNVFPYSDLEFELMSGDFMVSATEIRSVVDYCISLEMLFNNNGFISSESLDERLAPVYEKRGKAKELSKNQLRNNGKFVAEIPIATVVSVAEMPQSKVKEIKGNKSEVKESEFPAVADIFLWPSFDNFWNIYDKKQDRPKCEKKWEKINQEAREKIMLHLEDYILSTPDKQYRKNPLTYLNSESWENEIITPNTNGKFTREEKVNSLRAAFAKQVIERGKGT